MAKFTSFPTLHFQDHPLMLLKILDMDEDHGILVLLSVYVMICVPCCLRNGIFFFQLFNFMVFALPVISVP